MIRGIDVSSCQGKIAWAFVPDEIEIVIAKVTEAERGRDPTYAENVAGAKASGRTWGEYAFVHPGGDPIAQARNLWDATGRMPLLPPALDLESAPDNMTAAELALWFLRCADEVEHWFGRPPIVYTFPWFERSRIAPALTTSIADRFARCPLWMADWAHGERPAEGQSPFCPPPWRTWTLWQTSGNNSSKVTGITGAVDHDVFNGDHAALRDFLGLPAIAPDAAPTVPTIDHLPHFDDDPPDEVA